MRHAGKSNTDHVWREAEEAVVAGDAAALERLLREYADVFNGEWPRSWWHNTLMPDYGAGDGHAIVRSTHEFDTWSEYEAFVAARNTPGSAVALFEAAVDATVGGDVDTLRSLLSADPELVRARSLRRHHSTLLHYIGANGVEGFRQYTPQNAVEVLDVLLDAGADVNAVADMYGGSRTLGLVATSVHPERAGLQSALMERLRAAGAR